VGVMFYKNLDPTIMQSKTGKYIIDLLNQLNLVTNTNDETLSNKIKNVLISFEKSKEMRKKGKKLKFK
jgi:hypothetical protein